MKIKVKQLTQDEEILHVRRVNPVFVSRYRQAMRAGDVFPSITIDQDGHIISGNHRYQAYLEEFGPEYEIEVNRKKYTDKAERICDAIRENAKHGNPLDGISRKRAVCRLIALGMEAGKVAQLIGVSVHKIEEIAGMTVVIRGHGHHPVKHGLEHLAGQTVKKDDYETHIACDMGVSFRRSSEQMIRWIDNGWIDTEDAATVAAVENLKAALERI